MGLSLLRIQLSEPLIEYAILLLPLVSLDLEYQDVWCALKSPRISVSSGDIILKIDNHCWLEECRCWI